MMKQKLDLNRLTVVDGFASTRNPTTTDSNRNIRGLSLMKLMSALMNDRIKSKKMSVILLPKTPISNTRRDPVFTLSMFTILRYIDKKIVQGFTS